MLNPVLEAERQKLIEELSLLEAALATKEQEKEIQRCADDPAYWFGKYVKTWDEEDLINPIKPYPIEIEYCQDIIDIWKAYPDIRALAVEKSRRVLVTLTFVGLFTWDALFNNARLNVIISQNEEKANIQIERRAWVMYDNQPDFLKAAIPAKKIWCKFIVPGQDLVKGLRKKATSIIWSVPQENEQARGETWSNMLMDEVVYQTQARRNFTSALPAAALGKKIGPRIILVSTAGEGLFDDVVHDRIGADVVEAQIAQDTITA